MSGEAGQKEELFTGRIGGLIVTLRITPRKDFLAVFVQDPSATEVYIQEVTAKFLQSSETLSGFNSYVELYEYLSKNFAKVTFAGNALKFVYKEKAAFVDLVLKVRSNFPEALTPSEISQIEARIAAQKRVLQEKIQEYQTTHKGQIEDLQKQIEQLQKQGKQLKELIISQQDKISKQIQTTSVKIHAAKNRQSPSVFYNNPGNIYMFYYTVAISSLTTAKLVRQSTSSVYYNFVNGTPIRINQKAKYSIRATKINSFPPMVGFCTSSGNGQIDDHKNEGSAYYSYSGWINTGGIANDTNMTAGVGDLIECEVDTKTSKVRWWKDSKLIGQFGLHNQMKDRTLFLSIMLWEEKDSLDLAVVPV